MGDLYDELYPRPAAGRYGDDIDHERHGDAIPERHGWVHHLATGCRCVTCVAGCERVQDWAR